MRREIEGTNMDVIQAIRSGDADAVLDRKRRYTTDQYSGKRFCWNDACEYMGLVVPGFMGNHRARRLAPDRVPLPLLRELNPGVTLDSVDDVIAIERTFQRIGR